MKTTKYDGYDDLGVVNDGRPPKLLECRAKGHAGIAMGVHAEQLSHYRCDQCKILWHYNELRSFHWDPRHKYDQEAAKAGKVNTYGLDSKPAKRSRYR